MISNMALISETVSALATIGLDVTRASEFIERCKSLTRNWSHCKTKRKEGNDANLFVTIYTVQVLHVFEHLGVILPPYKTKAMCAVPTGLKNVQVHARLAQSKCWMYKVRKLIPGRTIN